MGDITLISTGWKTPGPSLLDRLEEIAKKSEWVIGLMAFFTHGDGWPLSQKRELVRCLKSRNSYLCVGWNKPTNFEKIKSLYDGGRGVSFFVNVAKIAKVPFSVAKLNDNLMHSKLLLFKDKQGRGYTMVIGSHNWTDKAIRGNSKQSGFNIEDSLILRIDEKNEFVKACIYRIEHVKTLCIRYRLNIHRHLLRLQDSDDASKVIKYDRSTIKGTPAKLYISFLNNKDAKQFKQGTAGYIVDESTSIAAKFESQGSWSSSDVKIEDIGRFIAPWDADDPLEFDWYPVKTPSPTEHLAELAINFMGDKHKAEFHEAVRKTELWNSMNSEKVGMQLNAEQHVHLNIRHWKEVDGRPIPSPEKLIPQIEQTAMKSIGQLESFIVSFHPPLKPEEN